MKVTIYVDWDDQEVYSKGDYEERLAKLVANGQFCDSFSNWLNDNYSAADVFFISEDQRESIQKEYDDYATLVTRNAWDVEKKEIEI